MRFILTSLAYYAGAAAIVGAVEIYLHYWRTHD